jgi:predicted dehydrogenase
MSEPIRIGFIGLNAKECWAVNAHLPYLQRTPRYRIVALLNSSEDAAKAAIDAHKLDSSTKAYGSPEQFAEDENIDLIVCSVRVDKHHPILMPILERTKAKAAHCEWPLGRNLAEAEELANLAEKRGIKTIVGLQGRMVPTCLVTRELVNNASIGRILSVTITASGYNFGAEDLHTLAYLSDINFGGNLVTIHCSHNLDTIMHAVGQLASFSAILDTQRKETLLRNKPHTYKPSSDSDEPVKIIGSVPRTSHDQILLQGHLENGASFSFHMRGGMPFPETPGLEWRIYGEDGEIRITTPSANLHFGGPGHKIQIHHHQSNEVEDVELSWPAEYEKDGDAVPWPARGPGRVYDAFAEGRDGDYASWQDAVRRHRLVEEMYQQSKQGGGERQAEYMKK